MRLASVGEQFIIDIPPPDGYEPPLKDIPLMVALLLEEPLSVRHDPPSGPGAKNVSSIKLESSR